MNDIRLSLQEFTRRFFAVWQQETGGLPCSEDLYGIPSPCITRTTDAAVYWEVRPFEPESDLQAVERAIDIRLHPDVHTFYTTQYAGDMPAVFEHQKLTLLQPWSEDDFQRVQENLIGHLVTQRRLKISPTLFLATTDDELEVVTICNLTGEVLLEKIGSAQRTVLASSLCIFLDALHPVVL